MSAWETDPTGYVLLALVITVLPAWLLFIAWAGWHLITAALRGRFAAAREDAAQLVEVIDTVSFVREQTERNARAEALWRLQYAQHARCPDLRDDDLKLRGTRLESRISILADRLFRERRARERRQDMLTGYVKRRMARVIAFPAVRVAR